MVQPDILVSTRISSSGLKYFSIDTIVKAIFKPLKAFFTSGIRINGLLELFLFILVPLDILIISLYTLKTTQVYKSISLVATRACESAPLKTTRVYKSVSLVLLDIIFISLYTIPLNITPILLYILETIQAYKSISLLDYNIFINSIRGAVIRLNPLINLRQKFAKPIKT